MIAFRRVERPDPAGGVMTYWTPVDSLGVPDPVGVVKAQRLGWHMDSSFVEGWTGPAGWYFSNSLAGLVYSLAAAGESVVFHCTDPIKLEAPDDGQS